MRVLRLWVTTLPWKVRARLYQVRVWLAHKLVARYGVVLARRVLLARAYQAALNMSQVLNEPAPGARRHLHQRPNNLRDRVRAAGRNLALQLRGAVDGMPGGGQP